MLGNASLLPADGSVVVYVNQFSTGVQTVAGSRRISSAADRSALISDINAITQLGANTSIGAGINNAAPSLDNFLASFGATDFTSDFRGVIDVSTDGGENTAPFATQSALDAINGVGLSNLVFDQVNCLGVGLFADCGFIPSGSFQESATDFSAFRDSLERKPGRELGTGGNGGNGGVVGVPEPSSLALFALAIAGIGAACSRRRRT